jgi:prepilin-type N-terminal cleavage/methylation domain-containing protein
MNPNALQTEGFTLIELLIVVAVIGILTAIATPILLSQQGAAHDAAAVSDLSAAKTAEAAYAAATGTSTTSLVNLAQYGYAASPGVTGTSVTLGATQGHFCIQATSSTSQTFKITWNSPVELGSCTLADAA